MIINGDVKAIIIIEKEGIFRRLCEDNFTTNKLSSILVTGCGFPDIAKRAMVSVLAGKYPLIPIYGEQFITSTAHSLIPSLGQVYVTITPMALHCYLLLCSPPETMN